MVETVATEDAPLAEGGTELLEEIRAVEAEVPEEPAPQVRYFEKCMVKPGHFPPRLYG